MLSRPLRLPVIKNIAPIPDTRLRGDVGGFKHFIALPEIFPKRSPARMAIIFHIFQSHAKGKNVNRDSRLPRLQRRIDKAVDLLNTFICDRIAPHRTTPAMNHKEGPRPPMRLIIGIGISKVKRQMALAIGIHLLTCHPVKTFRSAPVPLP